MSEKTRDQIDDKYKWDLESIYINEEAFNKDVEKTKNLIPQIKSFEGKIFINDNLYEVLKKSTEVDVILEKLSVYSQNKLNEDISNQNARKNNGIVSNLYDDYIEAMSYFNPEVLSVDLSTIQNLYIKNPCLKEEFGFILEDMFRFKPHTLSKEEEQLMSKLSKAFSHTEKINGMLNDLDIDFGSVEDSGRNKIQINNSNLVTLLKSKDREFRKKVFSKYYSVSKQFNNSFSLALKDKIEKDWVFASVKKYNSSLERALFNDNIDKKVYENLIETVHQNLDKVYKYFKLKQKELGYKELHFYDMYVSAEKNADTKYTFEEARKLVRKSLEVLGNDYIEKYDRAFSEKWIDVYSNKGKRSGAYSMGGYKTKPYILLNYKENYDGVSTLAHEIGHSIHTCYTVENNPPQYSEYKIFVAEVASTVNELLLANYILKNTNDKILKKNILNELLEHFKSTIYRQVMFAEFEKILHEKVEAEEILTAEVINRVYFDLNKLYYGENVFVDDEITYEWSRIHHFYYNFYVYKYATGLSAACHIVKNILENKENAVENYLEFLKTGGSDYPLNELKIAGVDLTDSKVIQSALDMFEDYLNEFEKLIED